MLVILTAVFFGLILSGCRFIVFEKFGLGCRDRATVDVGQRLQVEPAYQNIVAQHYAYYQFYGSTCIAIPAFLVMWIPTMALGWKRTALAIAIGAGLEAILWLSACDAFGRFMKKRAAILGAAPPPATEHATSALG